MNEPFPTKSRLTAFLYEILRDHVQPGVIEKIVATDEEEFKDGTEILLSNNHLGAYADELAHRLTSR